MNKLFVLVAFASLSLGNSLPAIADEYTAGVKYYGARDYSKAAACFEGAMRKNPAHPGALYYDAACYQALGQAERARALYQLVISIFPQSYAAAYARRALGAMAVAGAKPAPALPAAAPPPAVAEQPGAAPEADPLAEHLKIIDEHVAHATALRGVNRDSEAEKALLEARSAAEHLGPNHPKLADVLGQIGDFYTDRGDPSRAVNFYRRELSYRERQYGRNSTALADRMVAQSRAYSGSGDYSQAEDLLRRSIDNYQRAADDASRSHMNPKPELDKMIGAMSSLAAVLRSAGRPGEAKSLEGQIRMMQQ